MKVSLNSIKGLAERYNCAEGLVSLGAGELVEKIGAQLGAVEEVIEFGKPLENVLIGKVISCEKHPDADRLQVCMIDDGGKVQNIERTENGLVQVVCGAPNVRKGLMVAWLPPGSIMPGTFNNGQLVLEARKIRGVISNGMLASAKELGLGEDHDGIMELDDDKKPGSLFAEVYELKDDVVIDIENKMFTHRPDCFGFLGVARELAGIQQIEFKSPAWYQVEPETPEVGAEELKLEVLNELPQLAPRFSAVTMRNVKVGRSPVWLQIELARARLRPINNIVDLTNFFMIETGQPLHAYDYDKVKSQDEAAKHATIIIRHPKENEKLKLLGGKEIEPRPEAIMIATRDKAIGLGGVMGGSDTEVDENTTNIILESANFDMYNVRRTSMEHGLFSDAVTRFSKGQSPLQTKTVLAKITDEIRRLTGGKVAVASRLIDDCHVELPAPQTPNHKGTVTLSCQFINKRLGLSLTVEQVSNLLTNVEFLVDSDKDNLVVGVPFWRTDISIAEDVVEEVGRLYGYDKLPLEMPARSTKAVKPDELLQLKSELRSRLAAYGANELLTYSFVHGDLLAKSGQNKELAFKLSNALSPDLQYFRMSLTPSLLANVHSNIKAGYERFVIFELGKSHNRLHKTDAGGVPKEYEMLALVTSGKTTEAGRAYYDARKYLDEMTGSLGITLEYKPIEKEADYPVVQPFEPGRSALVFEAQSGSALGIIGEFKSSVRRNLKLPAGSAGFEIGVNELLASKNPAPVYRPLSRYPAISQDICLQVDNSVTYSELYKKLATVLKKHTSKDQIFDVYPIDIYTSEKLGDKKRITYRVKLTSYARTLTEEVLSKLFDEAVNELKQSLNAERI